MQSLAGQGYNKEEIKKALVSTRHERFRFELLNDNDQVIGDVSSLIEAAEVGHNYLATVKRTARFTIRDTGEINFLRDRIRPWYRLRMSDGGFREWPLGVYLLSTPGRRFDGASVVREVEGYGKLALLNDDVPDTPWTAPVGERVTGEVVRVVGKNSIIDESDTELPATRSWPIGTTKLQIVNDLLASINYESIDTDPRGRYIAGPYVRPDQKDIAWRFFDNEEGLYEPDVYHELDYFSVPNKVIFVVSLPDRPEMVATVTNENPASPTSFPSRGRWVTEFNTEFDAASQEALQAAAERRLFNANQVVDSVKFSSAFLPLDAGDVVVFRNQNMNLEARYVLHRLTYRLGVGEVMHLRIRRVVAV